MESPVAAVIFVLPEESVGTASALVEKKKTVVANASSVTLPPENVCGTMESPVAAVIFVLPEESVGTASALVEKKKTVVANASNATLPQENVCGTMESPVAAVIFVLLEESVGMANALVQKKKECPVCQSCDGGICKKDPVGAICTDENDLCSAPGTGKCDATGKCVGTPVECDSCSKCNSFDGSCVPDPSKDGTSCAADQDACTIPNSSTCDAGACVGEPVECSVCETCDVAKGGCVADPSKDGQSCEADEDACTVPNSSTCDAGVCVGEPVECLFCETCDVAKGGCVADPSKDGQSCEADEDACTVPNSSTCDAGVCVGEPVECSFCETCDVAKGGCVADPSKDGQSCEADEDACTVPNSSTCDAGACVGEPVECSVCETCDVAKGGCVADPSKDGQSCEADEDACTVPNSSTCDAGDCVGEPVECLFCETCDVAKGGCVADPSKDGQSCEADEDACTVPNSSTCDAGACVGEPVECSVCETCDVAKGGCVADPSKDGQSCEADEDACTVPNSSTCDAGVCVGEPVECLFCETCDVAKGGCVADPSKDGQSCEADEDACTVPNSSTCDAGVCVGEPVECSFCETCDVANGDCVADPRKVGKSCDDSNVCTKPGTSRCAADGTCSGGKEINCGDCHTCDVLSGGCKIVPDRTPCDDHNKCTINSECWDGVCSRGRSKCGECASCEPKSGKCIPISNCGRTDTCEPITIDFSKAANGSELRAGLYVSDEWRGLGLTLGASGGIGNKPRLFDTANPGTEQKGDPDLGAPNESCGGPGVGAGGVKGSDGENCSPLGNVE